MHPTDGFQLEGELISTPITLRCLAEANRSLTEAYAFLRTVEDEELHGHLEKVLGLASDFICELCYERNVDPFVLDYWEENDEDIIVTNFRPQIPG